MNHTPDIPVDLETSAAPAKLNWTEHVKRHKHYLACQQVKHLSIYIGQLSY